MRKIIFEELEYDLSLDADVLALMHMNVMLDTESIEAMHGRFIGGFDTCNCLHC